MNLHNFSASLTSFRESELLLNDLDEFIDYTVESIISSDLNPGSTSDMATADQSISVNGCLAEDKLGSTVDTIGLGVNLALSPETHNTNKSVSGPTIADVLGSDATPQSIISNGHPTVASGTTPAGILDDTGHSSIGQSSNAQGSIPSRYDVIQHVSGDSEPPMLPSSNNTSTNVQLFQRMDEVSARMIAMEEMFNKFCCKMDEQETTIQQLKLQNEDFSLKILHEIRLLNANLPILENPEENEKDGFVTDLLNSITNVSTNYLKKINSKNSQRFKRQRLMMSPGDLPILEKRRLDHGYPAHSFTGGSDNQIESSASSQQMKQMNVSGTADQQLPNYLTKQSFHLNPNAIKLRAARNTANTSKSAASQYYADLSSLNSIGSMSLPNLTLENLARKNFNYDMPTTHNAQQANIVPGTNSRGHRGIYIQLGSDLDQTNEKDVDSSDDEEGYQEDDEDKQSSSETDGRHREDDRFNVDDEEEDEADEENETDKELFGLRVGKINHKNDRKQKDKNKRKRKRSIDDSTHKLVTPPSQNNVIPTQNNDQQHVSNNDDRSSAYVPDKERDLNYTLLKAPANVKTIWQEYVEGIDGNPPVKFLEDTYGNKWRLSRNVKTFARRKRLYKFILRGMNKGRKAEEMIDILEKRRIYKNEHGEVKKRTIGWLQQSLSGI